MIFEPNFINKSKKVTALISQPENGCVSKKGFGFISYRIDELIRKTKKKEKGKNKN